MNAMARNRRGSPISPQMTRTGQGHGRHEIALPQRGAGYERRNILMNADGLGPGEAHQQTLAFARILRGPGRGTKIALSSNRDGKTLGGILCYERRRFSNRRADTNNLDSTMNPPGRSAAPEPADKIRVSANDDGKSERLFDGLRRSNESTLLQNNHAAGGQ